jgi:dihydroorotate dehydrogenase
MYKLVRSILFRLDPETVHTLTLYALRSTHYFPPVLWLLERAYAAPPKPVRAFGLSFRNPVGLAAGYDKDGVAIRGLSALGFGHIEIGTVTPRPQPGNPKPRVFRLVEDEAVINRMGFPGRGAEYVAMSLRGAMKWRRSNPQFSRGLPRRQRTVARNDMIIGVNLGKNKDTALEEAASDYISLIRTFSPFADYLAINVSSPNTVGLRRLQGREMLERLLSAVALERKGLPSPDRRGAGGEVQHKPILVKLAPDLTDGELEDATGVILACGMDGIVATNTTLARDGLESKHRAESGGLSGTPLRVRNEAMLGKIVRQVAGQVPVVSVGGIMNPEDAKRRLDMGATLVQVYTGLIYRGPALVRDIVKSL